MKRALALVLLVLAALAASQFIGRGELTQLSAGVDSDPQAAAEALHGASDSFAGLYNQGVAWAQAGDRDRARASFEAALRRAPRNPHVRHNLAFLGRDGGERLPITPGWRQVMTPSEMAGLAALLALLFSLASRERSEAGVLRAPLAIGAVIAAVLAVQGVQAPDVGMVASASSLRDAPTPSANSSSTLSPGQLLRVTRSQTEWSQVQNAAGQIGWIPTSALWVP